MILGEQIEGLKPFQARAIIEELRKGSVPVDYVPCFTVGRENWLRFIEDDLDNYIAEGGSKVRFINGDYGDGKTHFMSVIRHMALKKGFAVSFVVLTREVPMHKFEVVYREIVRQLQAPPELAGAPGVGNPGGGAAGLRGLVSGWAESLAWEPEEGETDSFQEQLAALREQLSGLPGMDPNFAAGLAGFLDKRYRPLSAGETEEERTAVLELLHQWFEGGKVAKKDLKSFQIFETLNKSNSKRFLSSLLAFLRYRGCKGLILLLDELETVLAQSASVRNGTYENVRLTIDNSEQARHLHTFFSIIPDVILAEKGFKSYDALWSRVRSLDGETKKLNYRSVLIDLHNTPLETHELIELGRALRRIHEIAYRWEATDFLAAGLIEKICENQKRMGLLSEVRFFIKQVIGVLDLAEQGTPLSGIDLTAQTLASRHEMDREKVEQMEPKWDT